jgi:hypothetical protein
MENLKDPVEAKAGEIKGKKADDEMKSFDIGNLSPDDFQPLRQRDAKSPHPFDGYAAKMVKVATAKNGPNPKAAKDIMFPHYALVALNPKEFVFKDPSGDRQSVTDRKTNKERIVDIHAPHNRIVVDYENGGQNTDICFDRTLEMGEGKTMGRCAFIKSHSARAQIMFKLDLRTGAIQIDNRYILLDIGQSSRLRRVFEMIVNPKIQNERLAKAISGESDEDLDEL